MAAVPETVHHKAPLDLWVPICGGRCYCRARMNLLLLHASEIDPRGRVRLDDRRAAHLRQVLHVETGQRLRAGLVDGPRGWAVVRRIDGQDIELELELDLDTETPPPPPVDILLALPRPKALRRLLQTVAAFGVGELALVNAWRVEKSFFASPLLEPHALREELLLGCEQGGRTWLPRISVHPRLMGAFEGLPAEDSRRRVLCEPGTNAGFEAVQPLGPNDRILLALGPEGGWIERELETFERLGFEALSLGDAILRTEVAVAAALAQLDLLRRL